MALRLYLKRLTDTDLTVFHWHFHNQPLWRAAGTGIAKQKAINLDADLLKQRFFPALASPAGWPSGTPHFRLPTTIHGPGLSGSHNATQTLALQQKNWRIGNILIENPGQDPDRYNALRSDDWVLVALGGDAQPEVATLVFLDADDRDDAALVRELATLGPSAEVTSSELEAAIQRAAPDPTHGIYALLPDAVEAILASGAPPPPAGKKLVAQPVYFGQLSPDDLELGRKNQERSGRLGEAFVDAHLDALLSSGGISSYEWRSQELADGPFDFEADPAGGTERIEVKATTGSFDTAFFISVNELKCAALAEPYRIYRVYEMDGQAGVAKLRICEDPKAFAGSVLAVLSTLQTGVDVTAVRVRPANLTFGPEIVLRLT
jgi:hypothetical protein